MREQPFFIFGEGDGRGFAYFVLLLVMDLKLFFQPLAESVYANITDPQSIFHNLTAYTEDFPSYKDATLAIVGVPEGRGTGENEATHSAPNEIRKKLYRLKKGQGTYRIVDLGNMNPGVDLDETQVRVREVCSALLRQGVLPILLGGGHHLSYGQYQAYEDMEKLVTFLNVDAALDLEAEASSQPNKSFLHRVITHEPNYLFHFSHLAYQSYLVHPDTTNLIETLFFEAYRLGQLRDKPKDMEPVIRQADLMAFDIGAIKWADAPGHLEAQPFGLTGEEACQICWYAGINEKMSSVGFYEYNPSLDDERKRTATVVATMVWYFIEGFHHRRDRLNFTTTDYLKYVVSMPSEPEVLVFYKSKLSEKWWLEVPHPQGPKYYPRQVVVPCSYSDYERANYGELPERWVQTQARLV